MVIFYLIVSAVAQRAAAKIEGQSLPLATEVSFRGENLFGETGDKKIGKEVPFAMLPPETRPNRTSAIQKIADGIDYSDWSKGDPRFFPQTTNLLYDGKKTLFALSRRLFHNDTNDLFQVGPRGRIISSFDLVASEWTSHTPFDQLLPADQFNAIFLFRQHIFLIGVIIDEGRIVLDQLVYWDHDVHKWRQIPLDVDPSSIKNSTHNYTYSSLKVSVPHVSGPVAYFAISYHYDDEAETIFSTFSISTSSDGRPISATVKSLMRMKTKALVAVIYTGAIHTHISDKPIADKLIALVVEAPTWNFGAIYVLDTKENTFSAVSVDGKAPPKQLDETRIFQYGRNGPVYILGGVEDTQLGPRLTSDVWALDFQPIKWRNTTVQLPYPMTYPVTLVGDDIYFADFRGGVFAIGLSD